MCHVVMVLDFCALKAQKGENSRKTLGLGPISPHLHVRGVLILLELKCRGEVCVQCSDYGYDDQMQIFV